MKKTIICWLIAVALIVSFGSRLSVAERHEPPLLIDSADPRLQAQLEKLVRDQGLARAVRDGQLALVLAIVSDPEHPRLAQLNGHRMMYAASLPKIAILLGAAVAVQEGRLELDAALREDMENMIRVSCNPCATRVLEAVGREELIRLLQSPDYEFYDPDNGGGLWVGKDYAPNPAYHRDPLFHLSHGATAFQVARFYYKLVNGTLVDPEYTALILEALSDPGIQHKFVKGLADVPEAEIMRKSGTWRDYHSDSALVHAANETYIIVGLTRHPDGGQWLTGMAEPLHDLVMADASPDLVGAP